MATGKVYSLFNASGTIEEIKPISELPLYCKVYCYSFAMSEKEAAIISPKDAHGNYKLVYISDYEPGFSQLDKYSRPHSQKFGIGHYYDDNLETWDEETVKEYIKKAEIATKERAEAAENKRIADEKERAELPLKYPHLKANPQDKKERKSNLVAHLKHHFPNIKFSVKNPHHDTMNIEWTDGPTVSEVQTKVTSWFEDHETDITGDYRDYAPSNFNRVFGGFAYIFEQRNKSEEVKALLPKLQELRRDNNDQDTDNLLYQIHYDTSFPAGAIITGIEETEVTCGSLREFYRITYKLPEIEIKPQAETVLNSSDFELVNYSDKALALFGDTKSIKDRLKAIGGRFNPYLNYNGGKKAGWIFSKTKEAELKKLIS
jgi:hypothetical protein